jgi:hypothetical protein
MRTFRRWTLATLALAGLAAGTAMAQDTPLKGAGPDQDQANNERYWGIVNNSNNAFKTWPVTLRDSAFDRYSVRQGRVTGSTPPPTARPPKPASPEPASGDEAKATPAAPPPAPVAPVAPVAQR